MTALRCHGQDPSKNSTQLFLAKQYLSACGEFTPILRSPCRPITYYSFFVGGYCGINIYTYIHMSFLPHFICPIAARSPLLIDLEGWHGRIIYWTVLELHTIPGEASDVPFRSMRVHAVMVS